MGNLNTTAELARRLKVHPKTVLALVRRGLIRGYKVGREWRFDERQLSEYLQLCEGEVQGSDEAQG